MATCLFTEIKRLGYTGCYTHLARFVAAWRPRSRSDERGETRRRTTPITPLPRDPTTGRPLSPLTAAALCIKPRPLLTERQATTVDALKAASSEFAVMRQLAMRFRGILRGQSTAALGQWLRDAHHCGIYAMLATATVLLGPEVLRSAFYNLPRNWNEDLATLQQRLGDADRAKFTERRRRWTR